MLCYEERPFILDRMFVEHRKTREGIALGSYRYRYAELRRCQLEELSQIHKTLSDHASTERNFNHSRRLKHYKERLPAVANLKARIEQALGEEDRYNSVATHALAFFKNTVAKALLERDKFIHVSLLVAIANAEEEIEKALDEADGYESVALRALTIDEVLREEYRCDSASLPAVAILKAQIKQALHGKGRRKSAALHKLYALICHEFDPDFYDLSSRLYCAEKNVESAKRRLAWLHEELEFDNLLKEIQADPHGQPPLMLETHRDVIWSYQLIDGTFHGSTLTAQVGGIWPDPEWRARVAATEFDLATAHDTANSVRHELVMSRLEQLQQMVVNRPTHTNSEPFVKAYLNEDEVSAFPDTGAAANFVSFDYAERHGLVIDQTTSSQVKLGNGRTIDTMGTTFSLFSFAGETKSHTLPFNVLRTSVYDVVLGSPFLKATETLTRYAHRIERRIRNALSYRICALGTPQRVRGEVNGIHVDAVPDTGAEVSIMSASFAAEKGFTINTDEQHCVLLEFADGSTAKAAGVVEGVEWRYGDTGHHHRLDVYVLPELSVDLLLGYGFLHETNAYVAHEGDFWTGDDVEKQALSDEEGIAWLFWIIKLVRKTLRDQHTEESDSEKQWQVKKCRELRAYSIAKKESELLPEAQRSQFMEPHVARWELFLETHPSHTLPTSSASSAASSSSNTGPATPSAAGAVQTVTSASPVTQAKSSSKFRLGWFKQNVK